MKIDALPLKRTKLSDNLAERLLDVIQSKPYKPGDRLPSITEMSQSFGVGHPTLREALRKLEAVGIVEIKHGSGVYVRHNRDMLLVSNPVYGGIISKKLMLDLIEARIPIEVKAAELAAVHATETQIRKLELLMDQAEQHLDNDEKLTPLNLAFHCEIAAASDNTVIGQVLHVLTDLFQDEHQKILELYGDRRKDHDEHVGILEAIKSSDPELSAERMLAHLEGVHYTVLRRWNKEHGPLY